MPPLCLVGYTYRGYPLAYALDQARAHGYAGIELRDFSDIDLSDPTGLARALERALPLARAQGLTVYSVFYASIPVSHTNERAAEEAAFVATLDILARYGVPILHTRLSIRDRLGCEITAASAREEDYAAVQRTLVRLGPEAEQRGVRIALETHMGTIHDTAASQLRIVRACPSPAVSASLDFANMLITHPQERVFEVASAFAGRIGYVHLKNVKLLPHGLGYDWNLPLRWGDVNYYRVLWALKEAGYLGPLAVEYCGTGDPDVFAEDDARYLQELTARMGW